MKTFKDFFQWYNRRLHGALKLEELESPEDTSGIDCQLSKIQKQN